MTRPDPDYPIFEDPDTDFEAFTPEEVEFSPPPEDD